MLSERADLLSNMHWHKQIVIIKDCRQQLIAINIQQMLPI